MGRLLVLHGNSTTGLGASHNETSTFNFMALMMVWRGGVKRAGSKRKRGKEALHGEEWVCGEQTASRQPFRIRFGRKRKADPMHSFAIVRSGEV